jgi:hypothetical protein
MSLRFGLAKHIKVHDRVAVAQPSLTSPGPRLCSVYPGNVGWNSPVQDWLETNSAFIKPKKRLLRAPRKYSF